MDVNAEFQHTAAMLDSPTLYPSSYVVMGLHGYTKHYYAGAERICAKIGEGFGAHFSESRPDLQETADKLFSQSRDDIHCRELPQNDVDCIVSYGHVSDEELSVRLFDMPDRLYADVEIDLEWFHHVVERCEHESEDEEKAFFCHSDHLGSASWITDGDGYAVQHLQYLPFGQPFVDQHPAGYQERFTFTGKERDEETGYGYFGARYMDHELLTMWLSVDPMADKYPNISPYNYCMWNPIKIVDPNGMDTLIFSHKGYYEKTLPGGDNIGIIREKDGSYGTRFEFADERWCTRFVTCDDIDIIGENNGKDKDEYLYNKIIFTDDKRIESILKERGLDFEKLRSKSLSDKIDYVKEHSRGQEVLLDFVNYTGVQNIDKYALILTRDGKKFMAHDRFNFGNFLWGMAMARMGMPRWLVFLGSHWDCISNTGLPDSLDDQRSIWFGYNKVRK